MNVFTEDSGKISTTRITSLMISGGFIADWAMHIIRNYPYDPSWSLVALVAAAMGAKVLQKPFEAKNEAA